MNRSWLLVMLLFLGIGFVSCGEKPAEGTDAQTEEPAKETSKPERPKKVDMMDYMVKKLGEQGITLDSAQQAAVKVIADEIDPSVEDDKDAYRGKREEMRKRVVDEVLTEEQRAKVMAKHAEKGKDGDSE